MSHGSIHTVGKLHDFSLYDKEEIGLIGFIVLQEAFGIASFNHIAINTMVVAMQDGNSFLGKLIS